LYDEVQKLKIMISEGIAQNNRLLSTLIAFSNLEDANSSRYLLEQFGEDMRLLSHHIDDRSSTLTKLHKELTATTKPRRNTF
jgi:hypothetical protein